MGGFTATLDAASPPAKALLSIGGAGASPGIFSNMVSRSDSPAAFIQSSIGAARKHGFDGLDVHWKFPSNPQDMSWETSVPSKKIVMGMPVYGRTWQLKDPNQYGIGAPALGTGPGGGMLIYSAILGFNTENNATVVFDNATYKVKFTKAQGLGRYFFWALGFDSHWNLARSASTVFAKFYSPFFVLHT
ncbi:hypothetical protein Pfo_003459 [Paulownia fortunei]|nr:hypothetical protein Pfo_003459 [Paulownia fortunei]